MDYAKAFTQKSVHIIILFHCETSGGWRTIGISFLITAKIREEQTTTLRIKIISLLRRLENALLLILTISILAVHTHLHHTITVFIQIEKI
ncbi:hypothetical protein Bca4012_033942 [Brassica carinata]